MWPGSTLDWHIKKKDVVEGRDLTAIHYLYSMPRGYRSRHRVTHEIMLSLLYLCFRISRLATIHYTELCSGGTVPKRLISPGHRDQVVLEEES